MKESTKEWLGIKPADFIIYLAFIFLVAAYLSSITALTYLLLSVGLILCILSCVMGMPAHPQLGWFNNLVKKVSYPIGVVLYLCLSHYVITH